MLNHGTFPLAQVYHAFRVNESTSSLVNQYGNTRVSTVVTHMFASAFLESTISEITSVDERLISEECDFV